MHEIKEEYITGIPWFGYPFDLAAKFSVPYSQLGLYYKTFTELVNEGLNNKDLFVKAAQEYTSILVGMVEAEAKFFLSRPIEDPAADDVVKIFRVGIESGVVTIPRNIPDHLARFPRDMYTVLENFKTILINPEVKGLKISQNSGYNIFHSFYGEGGRILCRGNTALAAADTKVRKMKNTIKHDGVLYNLKRQGLRVGLIPPVVVGTFSSKGIDGIAALKSRRLNESLAMTPVFTDSHIDRVGNLAADQEGNLHFVADSNMHILDMNISKNDKPYLNSKESLDIIRGVCEPLDIEVNPYKPEVPASVCFMQFENNKVLMTSGDNALFNTVSKIVGAENIIRTKYPLKLIAVLGNAGPRCIVNMFPAPMREIFPLMA